LIVVDVTKYFGAEVGALTNWDEKEGRYIVNGVHDAEKLQTLLDGFIKKFVLCTKCDNPETILTVKNGIIFRTCKACGHKGPCDNLHKLATFIKTNPPPKPVKLKQAKDTAAANVGTTSKAEGEEGIVAPEGFADGLADARVNVDEDDWDEEAAAANRESELAGLSEHVKNQLNIKAEDDFEDPLESFANSIEYKQNDLTPTFVSDEICESGIRSDKAVAIVTQILLAQDPMKSFQKNLSIFESVLVSEKDKLAFLGSLDRLVAANTANLLKQLPAILQLAYSSDLIEEEILDEWKLKPSKKYISSKEAQPVRKAAEPFFSWLKSLEDEDEDETDTDSDN
jgi:translation initiation factor 5